MRIKRLAVFLPALFVTTLGQAATTVYDSAAGTATIPEVLVNGKVVYANARLKLNSDGAFNLIDFEKPAVSETFTVYDPATGTVTIPELEVNGKVKYVNVKLGFNSTETLGVISTESPQAPAEAPSSTAASTTYDPATGTVTIPEVMVNDKLKYVHVILKLNPDGTFNLLDFDKLAVPEAFTTYDPATGTVTIPEVMVNDKVKYVNVRLGLNSDQTLLNVLSSEAAQDPATPPQDSATPPLIYNSETCSAFVKAAYTTVNDDTVAGMLCDQGNQEHAGEQTYATSCTPEDAQLAKVEIGMNYDQVVELAGCHPLLVDTGLVSNLLYATYIWGTKKTKGKYTSTHDVTLIANMILLESDLNCGGISCFVKQQ